MSDDGITEGTSFDERVGDVTTIVLSTPFVEQIGEDGLRAYVDVVTRTHAEAADLTEEALADRLREEFTAVGIELPDQSYVRTAQDLRMGTRGVVITTDDGQVIAGGDVAEAAQDAEPYVPGPADPADPERPAYS